MYYYYIHLNARTLLKTHVFFWDKLQLLLLCVLAVPIFQEIILVMVMQGIFSFFPCRIV